MSERDQFLVEIERLANSHALHGSESLCKLLRYLARHNLDHSGTPLKEYQIATEVFGRRADFDPQVDSTIRVQAGRLRAKLAEYYSNEGGEDPIIVELPKGSYALQFHHRPVAGKNGSNGNRASQATSQDTNGWMIASFALAVLLIVAMAVIGTSTVSRKMTPTAAGEQPEIVSPEIQAFWKPFLSLPGEPWLIFSNAAFVGRPETGMRYYNSAQDSESALRDHYTGVGEVLAVHHLDQMFETFHRKIRVKRGSLFTLDDLNNNDLIFLGSPSENLTLSEIPSTHEFVFQRLTDGPRKGDLAIVNVHPKANEQKAFLATPANEILTEDYAVVGLVPGRDPNRWVLILAGTTTFGTESAAEFVCRQDSVRQLLSQLPSAKDGEVHPFEALLHAKVARGVPVEIQLLAVHSRTE